MNASATEIFTGYFSSPFGLYTALAVTLFLVVGLSWIIITVKAFKDRSEQKQKDDIGVLVVVLRGLFMLLFLVAIFMSF